MVANIIANMAFLDKLTLSDYFNFVQLYMALYKNVLQVSPSHKVVKKAPAAEEVSVLRLVHFTHCPKIDFDKVKLGTERMRILRVLNPKDVTQDVSTFS